MIIVTQAKIPDDLAKEWLQHLRDFDTKHAGCHFEVMMQTGRVVPVMDMLRALEVNPKLSVMAAFKKLAEREKRTSTGPAHTRPTRARKGAAK
jgi:hypothetical protein